MTAAPITAQLYSIRGQLTDLDAVMERLAAVGADAIEPFSVYDRPAEVRAAAARHGLAIPTALAPLLSDTIRYSGQEVPTPPAAVALAAARELGVDTVIDPMVGAGRWRTAEEVARTADRMNALVEVAAADGMVVGYHNHSYEFHHRIGGVSAYEYFVSLLDPRAVLEFDVYWAAAAGEDVIPLIARLGSRVRALHLKDAEEPVDVFLGGGDGYDPSVLGQCALGSGRLPIAASLAAAPAACLPVVEFDFVAGDPFDAIAASVAYLRTGRDLSPNLF